MSETERRTSTLRRNVNSLAMRDGEFQESKMWAQVGKCVCLWLIYKYAELLINHWEVLLVLISWLIAPEIAKKAITMRFGGGGSTQQNYRRTERTDSSVVVEGSAKAKPEEGT